MRASAIACGGVRHAVVLSWLAAVVVGVGACADHLKAQAVASAIIDAAALLSDARMLSADDMQGRRMGTPGGEKARAFVAARFQASGLLPFGADYLKPFTVPAGLAGRAARAGVNVVGRIEGSREPQRYIVVSAHYDHQGVRDGQVFNGADDNASGTAALFALAAYFRAHRPAHSLLFVAFDGEEAGLLGSRAFVQVPPVDRAAIAVNVNIDMIGRATKNTLYVVGVSRQPFFRPYVERVASRAPVTLVMGHDTPRGGDDDWTRGSDQFAFLEAGIPALYFGGDDERFHHRATDDYQTMTHRFYVAAVETILDVVKELDASLGAVVSARPVSAM